MFFKRKPKTYLIPVYVKNQKFTDLRITDLSRCFDSLAPILNNGIIFHAKKKEITPLNFENNLRVEPSLVPSKSPSL